MMTEKTTDKLLDVIQTLIERVKDNADNINRLAVKVKDADNINRIAARVIELQEKQKDV